MRGDCGAMADDARVTALATYPVHFMNFDKEAFTADIINAVIEISTSNFTEMETYATRMLKITSKESLEALQQGLPTVFETFLSKFMEEHLAPWEAYCRDTCFEVPDGLVLPEKLDAPMDAREVEDAKLDSELNSLRERKAAAEKEVAELRRAIKALEAHVEAKACFMDAFDQLQNLPLVDDQKFECTRFGANLQVLPKLHYFYVRYLDVVQPVLDMGTVVRELRKNVDEAKI